jgi:hypothetical protein
VYLQCSLSDQYLKMRIADLEREIANDRLVAEATRDRPSLRNRLADRLYALAALDEGQPRRHGHDELTAAAA